jgi:hypothetical protein
MQRLLEEDASIERREEKRKQEAQASRVPRSVGLADGEDARGATGLIVAPSRIVAPTRSAGDRCAIRALAAGSGFVYPDPATP